MNRFLAFGLITEIAVFTGTFVTFVQLRRSQETRKTFYHKYPSLLNYYYKSEDWISGGHLSGSKQKQKDLNSWIENNGYVE